MELETTFVMIKPDGLQRRLLGEIISRFERKGLYLAAMKLIQVSDDQAAQHYAVHEGKPFYTQLVNFITAGPVVAMQWRGNDAIHLVRTMVGSTHGRDAAPGTIRGDFGISQSDNLIHASDSPESASAEAAIYFAPEDCLDYTPTLHPWHYDVKERTGEYPC
ncbi:MAG: nucleoside-diphosphate kinase [Phycisphaerales bacterium]|nr:nucleoside-diphosphate kinase [Phycisphaerales bacterium]MBT7171278.1 nucleoside-diphosphate kinase [Phycisphaerales bacterium]